MVKTPQLEALNAPRDGLDPSWGRGDICWDRSEGSHVCDIDMGRVSPKLMSVIAGAKCAFDTVAGFGAVDPDIASAKLSALSEGARL